MSGSLRGFFMKKNPDDCVQKILSDFAAGIMVAAPLNGLSKNRACCYGISFGIVEPLACLISILRSSFLIWKEGEVSPWKGDDQ